MANRAYIYFKENLENIGKEDFRNKTFYIDSRHNIPLLWWFLLDKESALFFQENPDVKPGRKSISQRNGTPRSNDFQPGRLR